MTMKGFRERYDVPEDVIEHGRWERWDPVSELLLRPLPNDDWDRVLAGLNRSMTRGTRAGNVPPETMRLIERKAVAQTLWLGLRENGEQFDPPDRPNAKTNGEREPYAVRWRAWAEDFLRRNPILQGQIATRCTEIYLGEDEGQKEQEGNSERTSAGSAAREPTSTTTEQP